MKLFRKLWIVLAAAAMSAACGCNAIELENKSFPLAVLMGEKDGQCTVCYLSQDLSQIANENADGENITSASAAGDTYYEAQKAFEKNNRCQLDLSHTKVLIFQKAFLDTDRFPLFLETVRRENMYARNTLVFLSDDSMQAMADLNGELEVPLGSYLEQMMENEQDIKGEAAVTLGTLLNEQVNKNQTLFIPLIKEENGLPVIHAYHMMQDFVHKGQADVEAAQIYYLLENQLQQIDLQLDRGGQVRLRGLQCKRDYHTMRYAASTSGMDAGVVGRLAISADAYQITGSTTEKEICTVLREKISAICLNSQKEYQIDLSDSYRGLARYAPDIYRRYQGMPEQFRKNLDYQVQVDVRLIK